MRWKLFIGSNSQIDVFYEQKKAFCLKLLSLTMFPKGTKAIEICQGGKKKYIYFFFLAASFHLSFISISSCCLNIQRIPSLPINRGYVDLGSFPSANVSAFLGLFQISKYYKPSAPFKDPNVQMVHRFHWMLVIRCSWASLRSAL